MTSTNTKLPTPARLPEDHPVSVAAGGYWYDVSCWIFAPRADFYSRYTPYMRYPPLTTIPVGGDVTDKLKYVHREEIAIPEGYDAWWYAYEFMKLDPLLIVCDLKDLDVRAIHRYGYYHLDMAARKITAVYPENPNGGIEEVILRRKGPFLPTEQRTAHPTTFMGLWETDFYYAGSMTAIKDTLDDFNGERANGITVLPSDKRPLHSVLPTRDVDWKGSLAWWMKWTRDKEAFDYLRWFKITTRVLEKVYGFDNLQEFDDLDPSVKRDILFLPQSIIDPDGVFKSFLPEQSRIIKSKNWAGLKDHLRQVKEKLGSYMGPTSPVEQFVGAYSITLFDVSM